LNGPLKQTSLVIGPVLLGVVGLLTLELGKFIEDLRGSLVRDGALEQCFLLLVSLFFVITLFFLWKQFEFRKMMFTYLVPSLIGSAYSEGRY
jgi:hypothetical protein